MLLSQEWGNRSDAAITAARNLDNGTGSAFDYAWLAQAIAERSSAGWGDPAANSYLDKAIAQRHPDGGFGLPYAWDAFGDGTTNPATATYTATLWQVGTVLCAAHRAGRPDVQKVLEGILDKIYTLALIPVDVGYGIPYSDHLNDKRAGYVVHNCNALIGALLAEVKSSGIDYRWSTATWYLQAITRQEVRAYRPSTRDWAYRDGTPTVGQDSAHNAACIEAMFTLAPGVAFDALEFAMSNQLDSRSGWTHASLAKFKPEASGQWLGEYDAKMAEPASRTFSIWCQVARTTALAAKAAEGL